MNLVYKIILFSLLSISLPIGKLFDLFVWNDRITKTEIVIHTRETGSKGRICFFVKIIKHTTQKLSSYFQDKFYYAIIERITNIKSIQLLSIQNNKTERYLFKLIRQFHFNITYISDPYDVLIPIQ
ncbi:MAG: hypothetical protein GX587_04355 [Bacteroidales bacterium]|nr:hypothetical protein [Bacteroidales bacterium]